MNEVAGGTRCPQCNTLNAPMAVECVGCGAALGQAMAPAPTAGLAASHEPAAQRGPSYAQAYPPPNPPAAPQGAFYMPAPAIPPYAAETPSPYPQAASPYPPQPYAAPYGQPAYPQPYPPQVIAPHGAPQPMAYPPYPMVNVNVSPVVNVAMPAPPPPAPPVVVVNTASLAPNMVVRALWFVFVGLWLGLICTVLGWAMCIAVITLPLGLMLLNRLPSIMTLRPPTRSTQVFYAGGITVVNTNVAAIQHPLWMPRRPGTGSLRPPAWCAPRDPG